MEQDHATARRRGAHAGLADSTNRMPGERQSRAKLICPRYQSRIFIDFANSATVGEYVLRYAHRD